MSDSYIRDVSDYRDMYDKDGNFIGINVDSWIDQVLQEAGWDSGGMSLGTEGIIKKTKFQAIRDKRRMYYEASGKQLFLENIKNSVSTHSINRDEFKIMIKCAMNRGDKIKFINILGILYGIRYYNLHLLNLSEKEMTNKLKKVIEEADENGVNSFDVIRYCRFIMIYGGLRPLNFKKLTYKKKSSNDNASDE